MEKVSHFNQKNEIDCYKESGFIKNENGVMTCTIRSTICDLLLSSDSSRCTQCSNIRHTLVTRIKRSTVEKKIVYDFTTFRKKNTKLVTPERRLKMKQLALKNRKLNAKIYALQEKVEKLERKCKN